MQKTYDPKDIEQRIYQRWVSRYQEPWAESLVALKGAMESAASDRSRRRKRAG